MKVSFDILLGEVGGFVGMILGKCIIRKQLFSSDIFPRSVSDGFGKGLQTRLFISKTENSVKYLENKLKFFNAGGIIYICRRLLIGFKK